MRVNARATFKQSPKTGPPGPAGRAEVTHATREGGKRLVEFSPDAEFCGQRIETYQISNRAVGDESLSEHVDPQHSTVRGVYLEVAPELRFSPASYRSEDPLAGDPMGRYRAR